MGKKINICIDCKNALTCKWVMDGKPQFEKWQDYTPTKTERGILSYAVESCADFVKIPSKRERVLALMQKELGYSLHSAKTYTQKKKLKLVYKKCEQEGKIWVYEKVEEYVQCATKRRKKNCQKSLS